MSQACHPQLVEYLTEMLLKGCCLEWIGDLLLELVVEALPPFVEFHSSSTPRHDLDC